MAILCVQVNGEVHIVSAPSKATARTYGKRQVKITVRDATPEDLRGIDPKSIPTVVPQKKSKPAPKPTKRR